jgi:hypothetical protein
MNRPLAAVWLVALVAVFAIFAISMHQDSPEPFALPSTNAAVPLSSTETPQGDVLHVVVDNLTGIPLTTVLQPVSAIDTPTPGMPFCPVKVGQICQIPPAVVVVTPTEPIICDATAMALMSPGVVCVWSNPPTFVAMGSPTPGGVFR